ncbi:hypothetical protein [Actinosynnema sp. NPDC023587]|uniref:hypothetical protein n=1 Tax=Actinosynnema sp. NPDC023587 TaxID=3154695 RepID=UPI0034020CF1
MEWRSHGTRHLVGAALSGARTVYQRDEDRPRCPWCAVRLRPGRVLAGWEPGSRRRSHACLECDGSWCVVADPAVLVDALVAYSRARWDDDEEQLVRATARLRELSLAM